MLKGIIDYMLENDDTPGGRSPDLLNMKEPTVVVREANRWLEAYASASRAPIAGQRPTVVRHEEPEGGWPRFIH